MNKILTYGLILSCLLAYVNSASAQDSLKTRSVEVDYGNKGFELATVDGNNLLHIEFRGQFRLAYPSDTDPITYDQYQDEQIYLGVNRARVKIGGHSYRPWLKYYLEYELFSSNLLDFRLMYEKNPWLKVKVGQWKVQYNRERIISSGKQQTMERSILTRAFTIDRQQGLSVYGLLAGEGALSFNYWFSAFMGTGRGGEVNDDEHLMYMSRLQWNPMGKVLRFSGSDVEGHQKFTMLIALAGVTNQSPYTRFSQAGGGQLEGFEEGASGQYRVNQLMQESAGMYKGFSWQQELHLKQVIDNVNTTETNMCGNLIQAGYFPHFAFEAFPKTIEVYGRHAFYYPTTENKTSYRDEFSVGANWFLSGHRLKLTVEASYLSSDYESSIEIDGWRYRLQIDASF